MKYREIRKNYQNHVRWKSMLVDEYASIFSPILTKICLRLKLRPNTVTMGMILFGIIGAILFAAPWLGCKIAGVLCIHLWYILDLSDGEVARITKQFSVFGTEIDYTAHLVNHPLFTISFMINMYQCGIKYLVVLFIIYILDTWTRGLITFEDIRHLKEPEENAETIIKGGGTFISVIKWCIFSFACFPLYALVIPIFILLELYVGWSISWWVLVGFMILYGIDSLWGLYKWLRHIY